MQRRQPGRARWKIGAPAKSQADFVVAVQQTDGNAGIGAYDLLPRKYLEASDITLREE